MLELARAMSQWAHGFKNAVIFLFNTGEEEGLNGAHSFVTQVGSILSDIPPTQIYDFQHVLGSDNTVYLLWFLILFLFCENSFARFIIDYLKVCSNKNVKDKKIWLTTLQNYSDTKVYMYLFFGPKGNMFP